MRTLRSVPYSYDVLLDEATGKHFLDVYCGGIASFNVNVELTPEEIERFRVDHDALEELAREIQQHSGRKP